MTEDRLGRSQNEVEDTARHAFAKGTVSIRAVADRLSEMTHEGEHVGLHDLQRLHEQLVEVWGLLYGVTLSGMGVEPTTEEDEAILDAYHDTYSDGSPVSRLQFRPPDGGSQPAPPELYEGQIPWLPDVTWHWPRLDPMGPPPAGWEVIVDDPPHKRRGAEDVAPSNFAELRERLLPYIAERGADA